MNKLEKIKELIGSYASPMNRGDDFNHMEYCGNNYEDCYYLGFGDGGSELAQIIWNILEDNENDDKGELE